MNESSHRKYNQEFNDAVGAMGGEGVFGSRKPRKVTEPRDDSR
jgi:hypothetical protein